MSAFELGSIEFKISMIIFIFILGVILTWGVFAFFGLDEYRENWENVFQIISDEELEKLDILAEYKIIDRNIDVYFTDKGIIVRDEKDLRMLVFEDILIDEFIKISENYLKKLPLEIKVPIICSKKIKYLFGGQNLKLILPIEDNKKKILLENFINLLKDIKNNLDDESFENNKKTNIVE